MQIRLPIATVRTVNPDAVYAFLYVTDDDDDVTFTFESRGIVFFSFDHLSDALAHIELDSNLKLGKLPF